MAYEMIEGMSRADIAFRVRESDLNSLFREGGIALISIMMENPGSVLTSTKIEIRCDENELDLLYHDWLSEIIYHKDADRLLLLPRRVEVTRARNGYRLISLCAGESIDRERHFFRIDIKAVTLHGLGVTEENGVWSATAVVDV